MKKFYLKPRVIMVAIDNIALACDKVLKEIMRYGICQTGKGHVSMCPACFDIETTTIYDKAFAYVYQLQIGKICLIFRQKYLLNAILHDINFLMSGSHDEIIIGIANLKYEWSFLCKDFLEIDNKHNMIFTGASSPLYAKIGCIKLVDICRMTNSSLEKIGKDFCVTQKLVGDLNYNKIRNSLTPLTKFELNYMINDVTVGAEFMAAMHNLYTENCKPLPLTASGIVRQIMKEEAHKSIKSKGFDEEKSRLKTVSKRVYQDVIDKVIEGFPECYNDYADIMTWLFRGGYCHGNCYYVGEILCDVEHVDYTSDYPAIMLQHKFPTIFVKKLNYKNKVINVNNFMSEKGLNTLLKVEKDIAFYAKITFYDIDNRFTHSVESVHKCIELDCDKDEDIDNGRIMRAKKMTVMLTEQDYHIYKRFYTWSKLTVQSLKVAEKDYLPWYVIKAICESYVQKKALKDAHQPYAVEKRVLNSTFGCLVQALQIMSNFDEIDDEHITTYNIDFPVEFLDLTKSSNREYIEFIAQYCKRVYGYGKKSDVEYNNLKEAIKTMYTYIKNGQKVFHTEKKINLYKAICYKLKQRAYNRAKSDKFLSLWWGIWTTAYGRRRLLDIVADLEELALEEGWEPIVVYGDTDSLFLNCHQDEECFEKVMAIIHAYNDSIKIINSNLNTCHNNKIDKLELLDDIGTFDFEPTCTHFKHLGAKRYLQRFYEGRKPIIECTIAGLDKKDFNRKLKTIGKSIEDKFNFFNTNMIFKSFETSKLTPCYITESYQDEVIDEYGNHEIMSERCGQVLKKQDFSIRLISALALKAEGRADI